MPSRMPSCARSAAASRRRRLPAARIRSASLVLGVLARAGRRARRRPGARARHRAGASGSSSSSNGRTTGATSAPDGHQRLAGGLAHPPRLVAEPHGEEGCCPRSADRHRRAARTGADARMGIVEKAEGAAAAPPPSRVARRVSSAAARTLGDASRVSSGNVWLCERRITARRRRVAQKRTRSLGCAEQRDEPVAGARCKPVELRSDPNAARLLSRAPRSERRPPTRDAVPSRPRVVIAEMRTSRLRSGVPARGARRDAPLAVDPPARTGGGGSSDGAGRASEAGTAPASRAQPADERHRSREQQPTAARDRADHRQCRRIHRPSISAPRTGARSPFRGRPTRTGNVAAR